MSNNVTINVMAKVAGLGDVEKFKNKLTNLTTSKGFQSALMGVGMSAGAAAWSAVGNAIQGAGQYISDSVGLASDLNESMSKANVVFGDSIGIIDEFGKTSAASFGMSKNAAYEATGTFGNLFKSMGIGGDAAATMSVDITKLAADLASFNNVGIDEALASIRSGLVGEAEPMRKFGVLLSAAAVQAKGMELGISGAKGEMTEAAKVQARYAIILDQTTTAQGDFSRTQDGLANTSKSLSASMEDLSAEIGQKVLPVVLALAKALGEVLGISTDVEMHAPSMYDNLRAALGDVTQQEYNARYAAQELAKAHAGEIQQVQGAIGAWRDFSGALANAGRAGAAARIASAETFKGMNAGISHAIGALSDLRSSFRTTARLLRDNNLATSYDAKRLPLEIDQAKGEVRSARKELENAQTHEQKVAGRIRLLDAKQNLEELRNKSADFKTDYGKTGQALGDALGGAVYKRLVYWSNLSDAVLRGIGKGGATTTTPTPAPSTPPKGAHKRAEGGPVSPGQLYEIGERGREWFVPSVAGTVVPNGMSPAGGPVTVSVNLTSTISARDVQKAIAVRSRYTRTSSL